MWRSDAQIPVASTLTTASSGAIGSGSGRSSRRTSPGPWKVTARTAREDSPHGTPAARPVPTARASWRRLGRELICEGGKENRATDLPGLQRRRKARRRRRIVVVALVLTAATLALVL